jgi:hypothetical protein
MIEKCKEKKTQNDKKTNRSCEQQMKIKNDEKKE